MQAFVWDRDITGPYLIRPHGEMPEAMALLAHMVLNDQYLLELMADDDARWFISETGHAWVAHLDGTSLSDEEELTVRTKVFLDERFITLAAEAGLLVYPGDEEQSGL